MKTTCNRKWIRKPQRRKKARQFRHATVPAVIRRWGALANSRRRQWLLEEDERRAMLDRERDEQS